ncbi:MAG: PH domain-containing protein, partial [Actinomycetota bacterium]|nr:PH domain-containing protein [Actinomycetota bacterium]
EIRKEIYLDIPIAQASGHNNYIVNVYDNRVEIKSGWQGQNVEHVGHKDVASVSVKGLVNCTLTLESNTGRVYRIERMARPEANQIKNAIERQKQKAGLYE